MADQPVPTCDVCRAQLKAALNRGGRPRKYCSAACRKRRAAELAAAPLKANLNRCHPATSERTYDEEEVAVLKAVEAFKKRSGVRFPTACELLRVLKEMGYRKCDVVAAGGASRV